MSSSFSSLTYKEALQIKAIARKAEPPPRAEDSVQETTFDASSAWGNVRQRLSRLIRAAARERAISLAGPKSKKPSFCPLDQAVVALTSSLKTQALRIGLPSGATLPPDDLFEVFFFALDLDGTAEIDARRVKTFTEDLEDARHGEGRWVGVDAFIKRCTKLQSLFGQGIETLRRDELETLALQVADYDPGRSGAVLTANALVGFLSCATSKVGGGDLGLGVGAGSQRHRSVQKRERRSILHTLRLRLDQGGAASDVAEFKDALADKETGREVDPGKLHRFTHKQVGVDLSEGEVLAVMRDIRAHSRGGGGRQGGSSGGGGSGRSASRLDRACLEAFVLLGAGGDDIDDASPDESGEGEQQQKQQKKQRSLSAAAAHETNGGERVIIDIRVGTSPPKPPAGCAYRVVAVVPSRQPSRPRSGASAQEDARHAGIAVASGGLLGASPPTYIWCLKSSRADDGDSGDDEVSDDEEDDLEEEGEEEEVKKADGDGGDGGNAQRRGLRCGGSGRVVQPGTTRLSPIVDVRVEEEKVSSELVAAGYTLCGAVGKGPRAGHLWVRRARTQAEARDFALSDLAFTAGDARKMEDGMHLPPSQPKALPQSSSRRSRHSNKPASSTSELPASSSSSSSSSKAVVAPVSSSSVEADPALPPPRRYHHRHRGQRSAAVGGLWMEVSGRARQSTPLSRHMGRAPAKQLEAALRGGLDGGDDHDGFGISDSDDDEHFDSRGNNNGSNGAAAAVRIKHLLRPPLPTHKDLKLWCCRRSSDSASSVSSSSSSSSSSQATSLSLLCQPLDTLGLALSKWGPHRKRRELEDSVRRALRQLSPSQLCDGPHAQRLDCPVDLNRLFNERVSAGTASGGGGLSSSNSNPQATSRSAPSSSGAAANNSGSGATAAASASGGGQHLGSLKEGAWVKLLSLAGLSMDPKDALALFRRLAASGDAAKTSALLYNGGNSAAKALAKAAGSTKDLAVLRAPFVAFVSRTDDEIDGIARQLRLELRRRFGILRHVPANRKLTQAHGLEAALGSVSRASTRGLSPDHVGFLLACTALLEGEGHCHLSRQELWRLCKRFDPRFRGGGSTVEVGGGFMGFVTRDVDHDASQGGGGKMGGSMALEEGEGGHLERVLSALEALREMVEEQLGRPGISNAAEASSEVWRALCHLHFQRRGEPVKLVLVSASKGSVSTLLFSCATDGSNGSGGGNFVNDAFSTYGEVLLEEEDLAVCVEGRLIGQQASPSSSSGVSGDGMRLSHVEATQLSLLLAPCNPKGVVSRDEFVDFFFASQHSHRNKQARRHRGAGRENGGSSSGGGGGGRGFHIRHKGDRLVVRPFPALLDDLSDGAFLGALLEAYGKWVKAARAAVKHQEKANALEGDDDKEWKAHKEKGEELELKASGLQREYGGVRDGKIKDVLTKLSLAPSNEEGRRSSPSWQQQRQRRRFYASAAVRASVGDPVARLSDLCRVEWASVDPPSTSLSGDDSDGSDDDDVDGGAEDGDGDAAAKEAQKKKKKSATAEDGDNGDDDRFGVDSNAVALPFRSANELALVVLHCAAHRFSDDDDDAGEDEDGGEGARVVLGDGGAATGSKVGGVHLVCLRSLVEGLCWVKHGAAPLVVPSGGTAHNRRRVLTPTSPSKASSSSATTPKTGKSTPVKSSSSSSSGKDAANNKGSSCKDGGGDDDGKSPKLRPVRFALGDSYSERFLSTVVRQLAKAQRDRKETAQGVDGWLGGVGAAGVSLLQSFAHPTIDPWPSRGVVPLRDFRKALALSGVVVSADEVEDSCGPFLAPSNQQGVAGGLGATSEFASSADVRFNHQRHHHRAPLLDYERFLFLLRRAWLCEWVNHGDGKEASELKDARKLLALLRLHYSKLARVLLPIDLRTNSVKGDGGSSELSGDEADALLAEMRRWYKMAAEGGGGGGYHNQQQRLGPSELVECVRAATEEVRFKAHERARALFVKEAEESGDTPVAAAGAVLLEWDGDGQDLPLAGGRARRLLRCVFDFFDDDGDGKCSAVELHALLAHGVVGDLAAAEEKGLIVRSNGLRGVRNDLPGRMSASQSMLGSLAFDPLSSRRSVTTRQATSTGRFGEFGFGGGGDFDDFGGDGEDEENGRGGEGADDDGDWILMGGLAQPHRQTGGGGRSSSLFFGGASGVGGGAGCQSPPPNAANEQDVKAHPSMALLAQAVDARWGRDEDRGALKQYLERHVRRDGCVGERTFLTFLSQSGLARDLNRREVAALLLVLDPSRSRGVPVKLVLECAVKPGEGGDKEKKKKEKKDGGEEESEEEKAKEKEAKEKKARAEKALRGRELERLTRHIFDVCTEYESLPGTGGLKPGFRQFDPRNRGYVSTSVAADVLAYLGCNLIQEECDLLWEALGLSPDGDQQQLVDYEALDALVGSKQKAVAVEIGTPNLAAAARAHHHYRRGSGGGGGEVSASMLSGGGLNYSRFGAAANQRTTHHQHVTFDTNPPSPAARAYFSGGAGDAATPQQQPRYPQQQAPTTIGKNSSVGLQDLSTSFNVSGGESSLLLAGQHHFHEQQQQQQPRSQQREHHREQRDDEGDEEERRDLEVLVKLAKRVECQAQRLLSLSHPKSSEVFDLHRFLQLRLGPGKSNDGVCSLDDLASVLASQLDLECGVAECRALRRRFGSVVDETAVVVDFRAFGLFVEAKGRPRQQQQQQQQEEEEWGATPASSSQRRDKGPHQEQHQHGVQSLLRLIGPTLVAQQRLGLDVGMTFEMFDFKDLGVVDVESFLEAMRQLDLRLSLEQLQLLVEAFAAEPSEEGGRGGGDRDGAEPRYVNYRAFLEAALMTTTATTATLGALTVGGGGRGGGGGGDFFSLTAPHGGGGGGGARRGAANPPRHSSYSPHRGGPPSSSRHASVSNSWHPHSSSDRLGGERGEAGLAPLHLPTPLTSSSPRRLSGGVVGAFSPTREAAVAIWGATTPLQQKGKIPSRFQEHLSEAGCWMCVTCLFADNSEKAPKCDVCGTANPASKGNTVHLECTSCHFQNSAFASACDMCNRPLTARAGKDGGGGGHSGGRSNAVSATKRQGYAKEPEGEISGWKD